jgi:hypothetical protein
MGSLGRSDRDRALFGWGPKENPLSIRPRWLCGNYALVATARPTTSSACHEGSGSPTLDGRRCGAEKRRRHIAAMGREIRRDSVPAPYATASEDISLLEKVSNLLEQAAHEVLRLEHPRQNNADTRQLFVSQNWRASCLE